MTTLVAETDAEVVALVEARDLDVAAGVFLLDSNDVEQLDISDDLDADGSWIERGNYRTVHLTCGLRLTRRLQWGSARLRLTMTLTSAALGLTRTWDVGVVVLDVPRHVVAEVPETYEVTGKDKLAVLDIPVGRTVVLPAGDAALAFAQALIVEAGEPASSVALDPASSVALDPAAAAKTFQSPKAYPLTENWTYLRIVNDVLDGLGYRGLWADRDGKLRSEPYQAPADRSPEWVWDADASDNIVGEDRSETPVYGEIPNQWVFVRNDTSGAVLTEGDGIYTVTNQSDGPSSVDARGRIVRGPAILLDAVDQDALVVQGDRKVASDKRAASTIDLPTGVNPHLWHFAVSLLRDSAFGAERKVVDVGWRLPLDGSDMTRTVRAV